MLRNTISGDESKNATKFHAHCKMLITQGLDLDNCICCLFSVLCLWQCNDLVRSPYCALLMSPRCCQSQGWDSHPRRGVQLDMTLGLLGFRPHLSLGRVYKLHIPSLWDIPIPHIRFLLCLLHPIFCIIDGPGLLGISGQGLGGGRKGHRDLRSNSCYLPSAVGGHNTGDAILCALVLKTIIFTPFPLGILDFLNSRFSTVVGDTFAFSVLLGHFDAFLTKTLERAEISLILAFCIFIWGHLHLRLYFWLICISPDSMWSPQWPSSPPQAAENKKS